MRILFVTEEPIDFSGTMIRGGQIHVRNVVQGLRDRGHEVHLVDWNPNPTKPFQHSISPRTRFVDGPLQTLQRVVSVGREIEPDVIISKTRKVYLPGLIASKQLGVPHVVHVGSSIRPTKNGVVERLDSLSKIARLRLPHNAYFVVCEALRTELSQQGVSSESTYNVRNAVDTTEFRPNSHVELSPEHQETLKDAERPFLGFVGSISQNKGVFDLAKAVKHEPIASTVLIAGNGPARDELKAKLGEQGCFLGSVSYEQMPAVYSYMDALVLPSYSEGLPRVILEAGATGKPVIASRVGGIPEIINDGDTGLLYEPGDAKSLAEKIKTLIDDHNNYLGRNLRDRIISEYSWKGQYDRYETFLHEVTQNT